MRNLIGLVASIARTAMLSRRRTAFVSSFLLFLSGTVGFVAPAQAATVTVVDAVSGTGISGAIVTVVSGANVSVTTTVAGSATVAYSAGDHVSVAKRGYATQAFTSALPSPVRLRTTTFSPLPVEAGSVKTVQADAKSGVFYALLNDSPDVYRSVDAGASWQLVTMRYDDPENGLPGSSAASYITTSGVAGEVLVTTSDMSTNVWVSKDFGVTWSNLPVIEQLVPDPADCGDGKSYRRLGGDEDVSPLVWSHATAGALSVVTAIGPAECQPAASDPNSPPPGPEPKPGKFDVFTADLASGGPQLTYLADWDQALFAFADYASTSYVVKVSGSSISSLPVSTTMAGSWVPRSTLPEGVNPVRLKVANGSNVAQLKAFVLTAAGPDLGAVLVGDGHVTDELGLDCGQVMPEENSVAPMSIASSGAGQLANCWLTIGGAGPYTVSVAEIAAGTGGKLTYDANWSTNKTMFAIDNGMAPKLSSTVTAGVPDFTGSTTAGAGIYGGNVADLAYGPYAGQLAIALNEGGGSRELVSSDNGATLTVARDVGAVAVEWWLEGSGKTWLAFAERDRLAVAFNGTSLQEVSVCGGDCEISTLQAVPGTNLAFVGLTERGEGGAISKVVRITLTESSGVISAAASAINFGVTDLYQPTAMTYCSTIKTSAASSDSNVLFVGVTNSIPNDVKRGYSRLYRVVDATGVSPAVSQVVSGIPSDNPGPESPWGFEGTPLHVVKANCATGVVYVGESPAAWDQTGLYKSINGGTTFTQINVRLGGPFPQGRVTAIGLSPTDAAGIDIYSDGMVGHSADAGVTWTNVYDPANQKALGLQVIEYAPANRPVLASATSVAGMLSDAVAPVVGRGSNRATVGSSDGAATANLSADGGVIGIRTNNGTDWSGMQLSQLTTDGLPVVAAGALAIPAGDPTLPPTYVNYQLLVIKRADALFYSTFFDGPGVFMPAWTLPRKIPGTDGSETAVAAAFEARTAIDPDTSGAKFWVTFVRPGAGVFVMSLLNMTEWSLPQQVTNRGDDRLPTVAAIDGKAAVVIVRPQVGLFVARSTESWLLQRVQETTAIDTDAALGRPSLTADPTGINLAFARSSIAASKKKAALPGGIRLTALPWGSVKWQALETVVTESAVTPSMVRKGPAVFIAYLASGQVRFAWRNTTFGAWSSSTVANDPTAQTPQLAFLDLCPADDPCPGQQVMWIRPGAGVFGAYRVLGSGWGSVEQFTADSSDRSLSFAAGEIGYAVAVFQRG